MEANKKRRYIKKGFITLVGCLVTATILTTILLTLSHNPKGPKYKMQVEASANSIVYQGIDTEDAYRPTTEISIVSKIELVDPISFTYSYPGNTDVDTLPSDLIWEEDEEPTIYEPGIIEFVQNPSQDFKLSITAHCGDKTATKEIDVIKRAYKLTQTNDNIYKNGNGTGAVSTTNWNATDTSGNTIDSNEWLYSATGQDGSWGITLPAAVQTYVYLNGSGETKTVGFNTEKKALDKDYTVYAKVENSDDNTLVSSAVKLNIKKEELVVNLTQTSFEITRPATGTMPTVTFGINGKGFDPDDTVWRFSSDGSTWVVCNTDSDIKALTNNQIVFGGTQNNPVSRVLEYNPVNSYVQICNLYIQVTVNNSFSTENKITKTWANPLVISPTPINMTLNSTRNNIYYNGGLEGGDYTDTATLSTTIVGYPDGNQVEKVSFNGGDYANVSTISGATWTANGLAATISNNVVSSIQVNDDSVLTSGSKVSFKWNYKTIKTDTTYADSVAITINTFKDPVAFTFDDATAQGLALIEGNNAYGSVTRSVTRTGLYTPAGSHWEYSKTNEATSWTRNLSSLTWGSTAVAGKVILDDSSSTLINVFKIDATKPAFLGAAQTLYVAFVASSESKTNANAAHVYMPNYSITISNSGATTSLASTATGLKDAVGNRQSLMTANATGVETTTIAWLARLDNPDDWTNGSVKVNTGFDGFTGNEANTWIANNLSWAEGGSSYTSKTLALGEGLGAFTAKTIYFRTMVEDGSSGTNIKVYSSVITITLSPGDSSFSGSFNNAVIGPITTDYPQTATLGLTTTNCTPTGLKYGYRVYGENTWQANIADVSNSNGELVFNTTSMIVSFSGGTTYGGQPLTLQIRVTATSWSPSTFNPGDLIVTLGVEEAPLLETVVSNVDYTGGGTPPFVGDVNEATVLAFLYGSDSLLHSAFSTTTSTFADLEITDIEISGNTAVVVLEDSSKKYNNNGGVSITLPYSATSTLAIPFETTKIANQNFVNWWNLSDWHNRAGVPNIDNIKDAYNAWSHDYYLLVSWNDIVVTTNNGNITISVRPGSIIYSGTSITGMTYTLIA